MKKFFYSLMFGAAILAAAACTRTDDPGYRTYDVKIQLIYPSESEFSAVEGVTVSVRSTVNEATYSGTTDAEGSTVIGLPAGVYEVSASDRRAAAGTSYILSGVVSNVTVTEDWSSEDVINVNMTESKSGQIVIKEFYCGGCPIDGETSRSWANDKYIILYNNSETPAQLNGLCLGFAYPAESTKSTNYDYKDSENLWYEAEQTVPAGQVYWEIDTEVELQPGEQITVALSGAINHTLTYNHSVDLSGADIFVTYYSDFSNATINPVPSELIPTSHWLKGYFCGSTTLFTVNATSPAVFIFSPSDGYTAESFNDTPTNYYQDDTGNTSKARKMVPASWVVDGMEVFVKDHAKNKKRLISSVDAGAVEMTAKKGYSLYRNVDREATEAIASNEGKLVYGYAGGADGTTDPSGIDAEASLANGALIIYQDTNNSTDDFHQRAVASIKK